MLGHRSRHSTHLIHVDAFRQRILRKDPNRPVDLFVIAQKMNFRAGELPPSHLALWLPAEHHMIVVAKSLQHPRLIKPQTTNEVATAIEQHCNEGPTATELSSISVDDSAMHGLFTIRFQPRHLTNIREVIHTDRYVEQQITSRLDPKILQKK